jgi:uncharacterized membrane protein
MDRNVGLAEQIGSLVAGGALLTYGLARGRLIGAASAVAGGALFVHGMSGRSRLYSGLGIDSEHSDGVSHPFNRAVHVRDSIAVNKPVEEVYAFWRDLANLPCFMWDVQSVEQLDETHSRWHAVGPMNKDFYWEAEIVEDRPNELIQWRTIDSGSNLEHHGTVRFERAPGDRGTIAHVDFRWSPPAGVVGAVAAKLLPQDPARRIHEDLRRLRQLLETGEIARSDAQLRREPSAQSLPHARQFERPGEDRRDRIEQASIESLPASDAPAHIGR